MSDSRRVVGRPWGQLLERSTDSRASSSACISPGSRRSPALIAALHGGWLVALFWFVPVAAPVGWGWLGFYGLLQLGRLWIMASLGARWTTRVITLPGAPRVRRGPYRFLRHPNYLVVALEIPVLPLAFGAWQLARGFGLANLALLANRIRHASSRVRNAESQKVSCPKQSHGCSISGATRLDCIAKQVHNDLLQLDRAAHDQRWFRS